MCQAIVSNSFGVRFKPRVVEWIVKISINGGNIKVTLSQRNIDQLNDPYTPPEYSLWKKVTVNGEDVWLNVVLESDNVHYGNEA
jgi:hypothetical protein